MDDGHSPSLPSTVYTLPSETTALGVILWSRVVINLPLRLTYPFLRAISAGLGVSLTAASALISVRSLTGIGAPLFGVLTDRWGGRRVMLLGVGLLVLGALVVAGLPVYAAALVGFGLMGLSKSAYDPAMQAYVGQRVPYTRRGRALGILELSWSAAFLGIPLAGWLIHHVSWRVPFALSAALGALGSWLIWRHLVPVHKLQSRAHWSQSWRALSRDRHTWLALSITGLLMLAQDVLLIIYGVWIQDVFSLTVTAIGVVSLVIGGAEALGELGVALVSDRLGKRRAVATGLLLAACGYAVLPRLTGSLWVALAGTAAVVFFFEFTVVTFIPVVSGLNATARGTLMSWNVAAFSVGRMVAAPLAVALYRTGDLTRNGWVSACACVLALLLLLALHERGH